MTLSLTSSILSSFLTVRALSSSRSPTETFKTLEKISLQLVALENDLPTELQRLPTADDRPEAAVATGISELPLSALCSPLRSSGCLVQGPSSSAS